MFSKVGVLASVVLLALGFSLALGFIPASVICTANCGAGVVPNFSYSVGGPGSLTLTVTDTSSCGGTCTGHFTKVAFGWGDGSSPSSSTNGGAGWEKLPTGATFTHAYASAGTYTVSISVSHELCGGRGTCTTWVVVGAEAVSVGAGSGGGGSPATVAASFASSTRGLTAWANDTTATTGSPTISSIELSWGDGGGATEGALGFSASHTYATAGTFNVTETVNWVLNGSTPESSVYTTAVAVSSGGGGGGGGSSGGGGGSGGGGSAPFAWSFLAGLLLVGGGSALVASFAAPDPRLLAAAAAGGALIGGVLGWGLGGFAWV